MRLLRLILVVGAASIAASTASAQNNKAITKLEAARAQRPNDAAVARSLGIAYYKAGKFAEARPVLEQADRRRARPSAGHSR